LGQLAGVSLTTNGGTHVRGMTGSLGMAAVCLVFGALSLTVPLLRWRQRVELFEGGFVWSRWTGTLAVPKHEVQRTELVTHHGRSGVHVEVIVHLAGGRQLSMEGLSRADQLANLLAAYTRPVPPSAMSASTGGWRPPGTGETP
ncbi:MAG TPA: hypothetical protein VFU02_23230, partial [Polyangiaceae bacterium]|nr:hypothetical protein [Polyangiaceae bacterium]